MLQATGMTVMSSFLKNVFERAIAAVILVLTIPILLPATLLVKRDGGPAFFTQDRVGKDTEIFKVLKLRTMVVGADKMLDERGRPTGVRITRFGEFLRKSSIDELPQLINIMKGDMALIGPRPILPRMLPFMTANERRRFLIRPGVTGLAQVKGRNFLKWSRRFRFDVIYQERMSLGMDLYILMQTVKIVLRSTGVASEANPDQVDDVTIREPNVEFS